MLAAQEMRLPMEKILAPKFMYMNPKVLRRLKHLASGANRRCKRWRRQLQHVAQHAKRPRNKPRRIR